MNRYWSGLIPAAVVAATAALGAQGQNPANSPPADAGSPAGVQRTTPSPSAQTRTDTITISGCLQNTQVASAATGGANRGATGGSASGDTRGGGNATGQTASGRQFFLNGATMTADGRTSSGAGAGSSGAAVGTSGTSATSYMLQGESATLTPHLNRRVEITGTLQNSSASATGAANARTGATASGQTLRVESVKMLAESCDVGSGTTTTPSANTPQQQR